MKKEEEDLTRILKKWIEDMKVSCPESLCQSDTINEDLPNIMEELCNVVGYYDYDDE